MEHSQISFSNLHKAKFDSGVAASRPASPDGTGDVYVATDTHVMSVCHTTSNPHSWTDYDLDNIGFAEPRYTTKCSMSGAQSISTATATDVDFDTEDWSDSPGYGTPGTTFTVAYTDVYRFCLNLRLDSAVWTIDIRVNDATLETYTHDSATIDYFFYSFSLSLTADDQFEIRVTQSSGVSVDVISGSLSIERVPSP